MHVKKGMNLLICLVLIFGIGAGGFIPEAVKAANDPNAVDPFYSLSNKLGLVPGHALEENTDDPHIAAYKGKAGTAITLTPIFYDANDQVVNNLSYSNITWQASGAGARVDENGVLTTTSVGIVTITVKITSSIDGKTQKSASTKIKMEHVPVDQISINNVNMTDKPDTNAFIEITSGEELDLNTVTKVVSNSGFDPTYQKITWKIDRSDPKLSYSRVTARDPETKVETGYADQSSDATLRNGIISATYRGQFVLQATIDKGAVGEKQLTKYIVVKVNYEAVGSIDVLVTKVSANIPTQIIGVPKGIRSADPTFREIEWSIRRVGTTGAQITKEGILTAKKPGELTLRMTIQKGFTEKQPYVQDVDIIVTDQFIPVTNVLDVPTRIRRGTDKPIGGVVEPFTATNNVISWEIATDSAGNKLDGGTGATIRENNLLTTQRAGTIQLMARLYHDEAKKDMEAEFGPYTIDVVEYFTPVTSITGVPSSATIEQYLTLDARVNPSNADNGNIEWSVVDDGGTGAVVIADKFIAYKSGTATIRATVKYGKSETEDYHQDFDIFVDKVFVPVTGISKVPNEGKMTQAITLSGTVSPSTATNKTIEWSIVNAGTTGAKLEKNKLTAANAGTVVVRATIKNGKGNNQNYTQDFTINIAAVYVAVKSITDSIPKTALVNETITLTGTITPDNATNKSIVWSIVDAGTTKARLIGNQLTATDSGTIKIRATVKNGKTESTDFTKDYSIKINDLPHIAVKKINNLPNAGWVDQPLGLTGTVDPSNATAKTIIWSIKDAGETAAVLSGSTITAKKPGTVKLVATIENGKAKNSAYTQEFSIEFKQFGGAGVQISGNTIGTYAKLSSGGVATTHITGEAIQAALSADPDNPIVIIDLEASRSAVGFSVSVAPEAMDAMIARNVKTFMIQSRMGEMSLSAAGLQQIREVAKNNVSFKLTRINAYKLPRAARKQAAGKATYSLSINYYQGKNLKQVTNLKLGSILFSVPATTNRVIKNPTLASLTNRGKITKYKLGTYDGTQKMVSLRTKKTGNFIVVNR